MTLHPTAGVMHRSEQCIHRKETFQEGRQVFVDFADDGEGSPPVFLHLLAEEREHKRARRPLVPNILERAPRDTQQRILTASPARKKWRGAFRPAPNC